MMAYSRGKVWRGLKTRDVHEIWDVYSDDSVQFLCLHFVREGEVFMHIPAFETQWHSNGRRVRLLDSDLFPMALTNVIGKNNYEIEKNAHR